MPKVEKGRKREPHSAPFIGDQRATTPTADFARKDSRMPVTFTVEEFQEIDPFRYSNVTLMKDGCPLHGRTVQFLTGQAVAEFCINGICTYFVLNSTTMAPRTVFGYKILILNRRIIRSESFFHRHPNRYEVSKLFSTRIVVELAYPTPNPNGSIVHGRHKGVCLNFHAKIPTARIPNIALMILGSM